MTRMRFDSVLTKALAVIENQIWKNRGRTFFSDVLCFDYVVLDADLKVVCAGSLEEMTDIARERNCSVAMLIPVQFAAWREN